MDKQNMKLNQVQYSHTNAGRCLRVFTVLCISIQYVILYTEYPNMY